MSSERKKKDGQDVGKKRQRMRASVTARKQRAKATKRKKSTDEVDTVKYKRGSAGDRTRSGAR
jgi:hypothetical protein